METNNIETKIKSYLFDYDSVIHAKESWFIFGLHDEVLALITCYENSKNEKVVELSKISNNLNNYELKEFSDVETLNDCVTQLKDLFSMKDDL